MLELPRVSGSTSDAGRPGGGFSFSQLLSFSSCCISASFGAPEGAWSGAGSHRPFKAGYPATWAIFPRHARLTFTPMVGRKMGKKLGKNGGEWGKMGFLRHLGPPGGCGRGRDRTALLGQGTQGVGPSSPDTPDSHLPRWFCEKWVRMGKMGFLRHLGAPGGGWSGSGHVALLGQGTPGHGTPFASGTTRPFLGSFG